MATSDNTFDELLIEEVRKYEILYESGKGSNKEIGKKENAWRIIAKDLSANVDDCKRRWKNLKDSYVKYLKSFRRASGSAAKNMRKPPFADSLTFVDKTVKHRNTSSNLPKGKTDTEQEKGEDDDEGSAQSEASGDEDNDEDPSSASRSQRPSGAQSPVAGQDDGCSSILQDKPAAPKPRPKLQRLPAKRAKKDEDAEAEVVAAIRAYVSKDADKKEKDQYELYALSLVPDFKRLSAKKFAILKARLATLMVELEFSDDTAPTSRQAFSSRPTSTGFDQPPFVPPTYFQHTLPRPAPDMGWGGLNPVQDAWHYSGGQSLWNTPHVQQQVQCSVGSSVGTLSTLIGSSMAMAASDPEAGNISPEIDLEGSSA